jgi:hypothetical protein
MIPENPPHHHGWRDVLAWGCVWIFLCAPPLIFLLHLTGWDKGLIGSVGYVKEWYFSVTGVLISLAGLKTWQQVKFNGNNKGNHI